MYPVNVVMADNYRNIIIIIIIILGISGGKLGLGRKHTKSCLI